MSDFNSRVIDEFRANDGHVGGPFDGAPMVLIHHVGRRSGAAYVTPLMYLPDPDDPDVIYVFASSGGAPEDPAWYRNLVAAGSARVEVGAEAYDVEIDELAGGRRDRVFDAQARRYPMFADYAERTDGIRTIPVLSLARTTG